MFVLCYNKSISNKPEGSSMDTLFSLIQRIKTCFGVQICVHDVSGVTYSRASLNMPYMWLQHGSAYCSVAKKCVSENFQKQ